MNETNEDESKRADIKRGKRVRCSSPSELERSVRMCFSECRNNINQSNNEDDINQSNNFPVHQLTTSSRMMYSRGRLTGNFTIR